jgi:hypothetical protein
MRRLVHRVPQSICWSLLAWLPMLLWLAAFFPGLMSADSLVIWQQATEGGWRDVHPPIYTAAMWVSAHTVDSPVLLTLAQSWFLAFGIVSVALACIRAGANRRLVIVVTAILACTPMVGSFAVTLWKDIPFTAAFLLVGARLIDLAVARLRADRAAQLLALRGVAIWAVVMTVLRQNGILVIGLTLLVMVLALPGLRARIALVLLLCVLVLGGLRAVVYPALGVDPPPVNVELFSVLHDVTAVAAEDSGALDAEDTALLERAAPIEEWTTSFRDFGCSSVNWQWLPEFDGWTGLEGHEGDLVRLWFEVAAENPRAVLANRLCAGAIAFRPDNVGAVYTVSRAIDPNRFGLSTDPLLDPLNTAGREVLDVLDEPWIQWLAWRAPLWIYAAYVLVGATAWRRKQLPLLLPLLLLVGLQLAVAVLNAAQDARYMMPGLLLAVLVLPLATARVHRDEVDEADGDGTAPVATEPAEQPLPGAPEPALVMGGSRAEDATDR